MKIIGKIKNQNLIDLHNWCENHRHLLKPTVSTYAKGRQELWIKLSCDLRKNPQIKASFRDERIEQLGKRLLPDFHIGLVLLYPKGTRINLHRDHTVFEKIGVGINLGNATFITAETPRKGETIKPIYYPLNDGDCYQFDTKQLHGIESVKEERWGIYFWHLKQEYLPTKFKFDWIRICKR